MNRDYTYLVETLSNWNYDVSREMIEKLDLFYEMLIEKNKVMNLTAITEFEEVIVKHYVDSLSICQLLNTDDSLSILDLGTGAGFPGIPLAILFKNNNFVLMDSLNKRITFLQEVVDALKLSNVTLVHARAEEAGRNSLYREKFDLVVSRAVANISTLSEYCLPFVRVGGRFISYKSGDISEEIERADSAICKLGGHMNSPFYFDLPKSEIKRSFIIIDKNKPTSKAYPRKAGTPSKEPLK